MIVSESLIHALNCDSSSSFESEAHIQTHFSIDFCYSISCKIMVTQQEITLDLWVKVMAWNLWHAIWMWQPHHFTNFWVPASYVNIWHIDHTTSLAGIDHTSMNGIKVHLFLQKRWYQVHKRLPSLWLVVMLWYWVGVVLCKMLVHVLLINSCTVGWHIREQTDYLLLFYG